jgi:uncharacterized protein
MSFYMSLSSPARIQTLDVLRGIAILGILLANISAFAHPAFLEALSLGRGFSFFEPHLHAFASGKFRGMLSIMLGVGLWIQYKSLREKPGDPSSALMRRYGLLMLLGAIHGIFIWWGDILFSYGLAAMLAIACIKMEDAKLKKLLVWVGWIMIALTSLFCILYALVSPDSLKPVVTKAPEPDEVTQILKAVTDFELWAHTKGGYLPQLGFRAGMSLAMMLSVTMLGPVFAFNMLIGIYLSRKGVLAQPSQHPKTIRKMLLLGFGVGLPLNAIVLFIPKGSDFAQTYTLPIELCFSVILSLGYMAIIAILVEKFKGKIWTPLVAVGRMGLSNYIIQSLLCTTIFYSWGFAQYGKLNQNQMMQVILGVWAFNILFSMIWLKLYDIGPFEWVWRSMVAKRKLPWKNQKSALPPIVA